MNSLKTRNKLKTKRHCGSFVNESENRKCFHEFSFMVFRSAYKAWAVLKLKINLFINVDSFSSHFRLKKQNAMLVI